MITKNKLREQAKDSWRLSIVG